MTRGCPETTTITVGEVEVSNADKLLFPADGYTKQDLATYVRDVAEVMLPHVRGRPLALVRLPDGLGSNRFFQKEAPEHFPDYVHRVTLPKQRGETNYAVADNPATLVYLANLGCLELHVWPSRADRPRHPDRLIFDLDPSADDFDAVRSTARGLREILEEVGLVPFVMTSGSRGLHVVCPLDRSAHVDEARAFARDVAEVVMRRDPDCCTTEQRKAKRGARIFLDVGRNAYAQHSVAPYSVRAKDGARVATPLGWDEVGTSKLTPRRYTIANVLRRLAQKPDPWRDIDDHARGLAESSERLAGLSS